MSSEPGVLTAGDENREIRPAESGAEFQPASPAAITIPNFLRNTAERIIGTAKRVHAGVRHGIEKYNTTPKESGLEPFRLIREDLSQSIKIIKEIDGPEGKTELVEGVRYPNSRDAFNPTSIDKLLPPDPFTVRGIWDHMTYVSPDTPRSSGLNHPSLLGGDDAFNPPKTDFRKKIAFAITQLAISKEDLKFIASKDGLKFVISDEGMKRVTERILSAVSDEDKKQAKKNVTLAKAWLKKYLLKTIAESVAFPPQMLNAADNAAVEFSHQVPGIVLRIEHGLKNMFAPEPVAAAKPEPIDFLSERGSQHPQKHKKKHRRGNHSPVAAKPLIPEKIQEEIRAIPLEELTPHPSRQFQALARKAKAKQKSATEIRIFVNTSPSKHNPPSHQSPADEDITGSPSLEAKWPRDVSPVNKENHAGSDDPPEGYMDRFHKDGIHVKTKNGYVRILMDKSNSGSRRR